VTGAAPSGTAHPTARGLDVERIRADFPILARRIGDHPLVYLDNAATGQKPQAVIDAVSSFYRTTNANIHRGVHTLSVEATNAYEAARATMQRFVGAARPEEIVFVRGATEGINLVASAWGGSALRAGDEIIVSTMEHHSNIVPWQLACERAGARLRVVPVTDDGRLDMDAYAGLFTDRTRLVATIHVSNTLGTINPVREIVEIAHARDVPVLLDGAQAAPHLAIDVQAIGCDFYAIAGHKMFGPSGIGVLYGRLDHLEAMAPYQGGGEMILSVSFDGTTYNRVPHKFEAGTPNIAGAIGLAAAADYLTALGLDRVAAWEHDLLEHGTAVLTAIDGVRLIGTAPEKAAVLSFVVDGIHPHDLGTVLDQQGIAVRTGHHCTQPLMERYGLPATARASLAFYNTKAEIDALGAGLRRAIEVFG
jgi:cysteine desulfurase/selenocysteine lyase